MTVTDVEMERTGSHHVSDECARGGYREEVYAYFRATWRKRPVIVTMQADRYTHSSGLSEWRIYATEARYFDPERNGGRGELVTDTARQRLSEACRPAVAAWLDSDEYPASLADAVRNMIVREMGDRYRPNTARELLARYGDRLTLAQSEAITAAMVARDEFAATLEKAGQS